MTLSRGEYGWVDAGTVLHFEPQPNKSYIPRLGQYFPSYEVVKMEAYNALRKRVQELECSVELDQAAYAILGRLHQQVLDLTAQLATLTTAHQQAVNERDECKAELEAEQMHAGCERHQKLVDTLKAQLSESHDSIQSAAGVVADLQASLQQAVEALAGVRNTLFQHWITAIECNHEAKTDTVRCACSVWTGTEQPCVGDAVKEWIAHVFEQATKVEHVCGLQGFGRGYGSEHDVCPACRRNKGGGGT